MYDRCNTQRITSNDAIRPFVDMAIIKARLAAYNINTDTVNITLTNTHMLVTQSGYWKLVIRYCSWELVI